MKRDLKLLFQEAGKKIKEGEHEVGHDLNSLSKKLERHHINLTATSLRKLMDLVTGKRKLSIAAKNRLALFAGFQTWGRPRRSAARRCRWRRELCREISGQ